MWGNYRVQGCEIFAIRKGPCAQKVGDHLPRGSGLTSGTREICSNPGFATV